MSCWAAIRLKTCGAYDNCAVAWNHQLPSRTSHTGGLKFGAKRQRRISSRKPISDMFFSEYVAHYPLRRTRSFLQRRITCTSLKTSMILFCLGWKQFTALGRGVSPAHKLKPPVPKGVVSFRKWTILPPQNLFFPGNTARPDPTRLESSKNKEKPWMATPERTLTGQQKLTSRQRRTFETL